MTVYDIEFTYSDGRPRPFSTWPQIRQYLLDRFGSASAAYDCYTAYNRDRDGWVLSPREQVLSVSWRATLEECFMEFSRPECAVIIVTKKTVPEL